jgi:hypothetical protein
MAARSSTYIELGVGTIQTCKYCMVYLVEDSEVKYSLGGDIIGCQHSNCSGIHIAGEFQAQLNLQLHNR